MLKGWGKIALTVLVVWFVAGGHFSTLPARAQTDSNMVDGTNDGSPAIAGTVPAGIKIPAVDWHFQAIASGKGATNSVDANSATFKWRQPESIVANDELHIVYQVQMAHESDMMSGRFGSGEAFFNLRGGPWKNAPNTIIDGEQGPKSYQIESPGARLTPMIYRLVLGVYESSAGGLAFTGRRPNEMFPVSRDDYVLAYTTRALKGADLPESENFVYKITATLDSKAKDTAGQDFAATIKIFKKSDGTNITSRSCSSGASPPLTSRTCRVWFDQVPKGEPIAFVLALGGDVSPSTPTPQEANKTVVVDFHANHATPTVTITTTNAAGEVLSSTDPNDCNKFIGFSISGGLRFDLGRYVACNLIKLGSTIVKSMTGIIEKLASTNPWDFINPKLTDNTNGQAILSTWKAILGLVDVIVIIGLLAAAFSSIFKFLPVKLDSYQIKSALPGIIWGIILANLSFFALHVLIESASIATQGVADFTHRTAALTDPPDSGAGSYLMAQAFKAISTSLVNMPFFRSPIIGGPGGNIATDTFTALGGVLTGLEGTVLAFIALTIFALVIIIAFLILLFLLYVRNWVIILLFILSPLAFFALGFPPLRAVWQKWWGTFWKWLLMLPVSLAVVAFTIILTNAHNVALTQSGEPPDVFGYFFFNGIALALLYFALRVPFMWGQVMGFNVMDKWSQYGKKTARFAGDVAPRYIAGNIAGRLAGQKKYAEEMTEEAKKKRFDDRAKAGFEAYNRARGDKGEAPIGMSDFEKTTEYQKIKRDQPAANETAARQAAYAARKSEAGKKGTEYAARWNAIRQYEGLEEGVKARLAVWDKGEERLRHRTDLYKRAAGPEAWFRQAADDLSFIKDNFDPQSVGEGFAKKLKDIPESLKAQIRSKDWVQFTAIMSQAPAMVAVDPLLGKMNAGDRAELQLWWRQHARHQGRRNVGKGWRPGGAAAESIKADGDGFKFEQFIESGGRGDTASGGTSPYGEVSPAAEMFMSGTLPAADARRVAEREPGAWLGSLGAGHAAAIDSVIKSAGAYGISAESARSALEAARLASEGSWPLTPDMVSGGQSGDWQKFLTEHIAPYRNKYDKYVQGINMTVGDDTRIGGKIVLDMIPDLRLTPENFSASFDGMRKSMANFIGELSVGVIDAGQLENIRQRMGQVIPERMLPREFDRDVMRQKLLALAKQTKKGMELFGRRPLQEALATGLADPTSGNLKQALQTNINRSLQGEMKLDAIETHVIGGVTAAIEGYEQAHGPVVVEQMMKNPNVATFLHQVTQDMVNVEPNNRAVTSRLSPEDQNRVVGVVVNQFAETIAGHLATQRQSKTNFHISDLVKNDDERLALQNQLRDVVEATIRQADQSQPASPPASPPSSGESIATRFANLDIGATPPERPRDPEAADSPASETPSTPEVL